MNRFTSNKTSTFLFLCLVLGIIATSFLFIDAELAKMLENLSINVKRHLKSFSKLFAPEFHLILAAIALPFIFLKRRQTKYQPFLFLYASIFVTGVTVKALKYIVGRSRPSELIKHNIEGFDFFSLKSSYHSFPSGHTCIIFASIYVLSMYFPKQKLLLISLGFIISLVRVVINKHYLSDVIATGFLVWFLAKATCDNLNKKMQRETAKENETYKV